MQVAGDWRSTEPLPATPMGEADFVAALRTIATDPAARGLADDVAVLGGGLVLTHDMLVEGVHFLPGDPAEDVAWKLVAVNLSDLAGKGARPAGALLGAGLGGDAAWDRAFIDGLAEACRHFRLPLLGGDTVRMPAGAPRTLGLTAIGLGGDRIPSRAQAEPGDVLWVTGTIGDAGAGLEVALGRGGPEALLRRYRRPEPRLAAGLALVPRARAMMDVSDGLLLDARRMAEASGAALVIDLDAVPLSAELLAHRGEGRAARLAAATAGDDYELLFATAPADASAVLTLRQSLGLRITLVGRFDTGAGLSIMDAEGAVPLPARLGYEHDQT